VIYGGDTEAAEREGEEEEPVTGLFNCDFTSTYCVHFDRSDTHTFRTIAKNSLTKWHLFIMNY
jgi:hypothetical protein